MNSAIDTAPIERTGVPVRSGHVATPRWSRRRGVMSAFGALGVVGLSVAMVVPTAVALTDTPAVAETVSTYSLALTDAQNLTIATEADPFSALARGAFEVYVKPKPTPPPAPKAAPGSSAPGSSNRGGGAPKYTGGGAPADWMSAAGISESDWGFVNYIVSKESGWNPNATNRSSGACGLVQIYPCSKVANTYDPIVNLRWANGYATGRYGSWAGAHAFWTRNHWW